MKFSKYNIFSKIKDSDNYYLINILTGNADILSPEMAKEVMENNISDKDEFIEKGYLCDESEEKKLFINKYFDFIENRDKDEVQIFFVPWYACNFSCSYCYQSGYENEAQPLSNEVIDSFFNYIKKEFASRRKYITIFGGEPLLPGKRTHDTIEYILDKASELNIDTAFVTNGYCLDEYVPLFKGKKIREIQVTLDGVGKTHNERRPLKNMDPTFEKIVHGIDMALENNLTVNLRAVIDKGNITCLNDLAGFAVEKGWTKSPFFKTQLGRNYELHYCQPGNSRLMTRLEFYEEIYNQLKEHPQIIEFYKP
ncbi:MAG: radical SAM protein, partial [Bacteroidota bacterium]|nr:radical SAM protein [Bacteroidota bacterium]